MDNNRAILLAVLAAAACAGAYILWGPSGRRKRKKAQVPGLVNLGRSCFLNSVLQALASCCAIVDWLSALDDRTGRPVAPQQQKQGSFADETRRLIASLSWMLRVLNRRVPEQEQTEVADANQVLRALHSHRWLISNDEQDAHEMFHVLTTTIEEEVEAGARVACSLADVGLPLDADDKLRATPTTCTSRATSRSCQSLPPPRFRETETGQLPFRGLLASQLKCRSCGFKSPVKFDSFDSLSLSIPTGSWTRLTLLTCLRHFMKPEQVHEVECDHCSMAVTSPMLGATPAKVKSTFVKQLAIGKLPDVLCIHIQRMAWLDNGMPVKKYEHVVFPEILSMNEFVYSHHKERGASRNHVPEVLGGSLVGGSGVNGSAGVPADRSLLNNGAALSASMAKLGLCDQRRTANDSSAVIPCARATYRLRAVIVHLGDVYSGHFVTYRRGALGSVPGAANWFLCSDTTVRPVSTSDVLKCDAYMLLYEKTS